MLFLTRPSRKGDTVAIDRINPPGLGRPSGFSHAVAVTGRTIVFLAGQTAPEADGVVAQFERSLGNLLIALKAAGGQPADLVTMTIYVVNIDDYRTHAREIGAVWRRLAGTDYPAMAAIEVSRLWDEAALVEIQAIAAPPE
jgi:enamine deaminase RidA (YjgF/YER057c/UK114 family)